MLAAGCSATPPAPPRTAAAGSGSGTIVWEAGPEAATASDDVRQVLIDAFQQAHPSIRVTLSPGYENTDQLRIALYRSLRSGAATPDVYSGDVIWPYQFAQAKVALALNTYLPPPFWRRFRSTGARGSDAMVQAVTYRGKEYAVPYFVDEGFLYYRKDLLAKAGLPPPTTWEELAHDATVLKQKHMTYQFAWQGNNYEGLTCFWYEMMADAFGGLPAGRSPAADLDSPQALKALTFMRDLIADGISPKNTDTFTEPQADAAFDSGKAAFLRSWDASYADAMSSVSRIARPQDVGVEPPPAFQGQSGTGWSTLGGWSLFVNPHTQNLNADITFIRWMAGPQAQQILATQYQEIPAVASVLTSPSIVAHRPVLQAAARTRLVLRPSAMANYQAITDAIHQYVYRALPGGSAGAIAPCRALLDAAAQISPALRLTLSCPGRAAGHG